MERHPFPYDLLKAQTAWYVTYGQLAADSTDDTAGQRRRLLQLSRTIAGHPYWHTPAGTPAARMALKELARTRARVPEPPRPGHAGERGKRR
ncbi:hypothetical protein [Streptomyces sp. NPDC059398]|uniref:hypothetical protein n=1 Tax=Streptomyces sp. NPDC059398 TaxID=3346820 RepID=UPI0036AF7B29